MAEITMLNDTDNFWNSRDHLEQFVLLGIPRAYHKAWHIVDLKHYLLKELMNEWVKNNK